MTERSSKFSVIKVEMKLLNDRTLRKLMGKPSNLPSRSRETIEHRHRPARTWTGSHRRTLWGYLPESLRLRVYWRVYWRIYWRLCWRIYWRVYWRLCWETCPFAGEYCKKFVKNDQELQRLRKIADWKFSENLFETLKKLLISEWLSSGEDLLAYTKRTSPKTSRNFKNFYKLSAFDFWKIKNFNFSWSPKDRPVNSTIFCFHFFVWPKVRQILVLVLLWRCTSSPSSKCSNFRWWTLTGKPLCV